MYGFGIVEIPSKFILEERILDDTIHSYGASIEKDGVDITFSSVNLAGSNLYEDFRYNPKWSINSTEVKDFIKSTAGTLELTAQLYLYATKADLSQVNQVKMFAPKISQIQGIRSLTMSGRSIGIKGEFTFNEEHRIPRNNFILLISFRCPEKDVAKWRPVFDRILDTMILDRR